MLLTVTWIKTEQRTRICESVTWLWQIRQSWLTGKWMIFYPFQLGFGADTLWSWQKTTLQAIFITFLSTIPEEWALVTCKTKLAWKTKHGRSFDSSLLQEHKSCSVCDHCSKWKPSLVFSKTRGRNVWIALFNVHLCSNDVIFQNDDLSIQMLTLFNHLF